MNNKGNSNLVSVSIGTGTGMHFSVQMPKEMAQRMSEMCKAQPNRSQMAIYQELMMNPEQMQ